MLSRPIASKTSFFSSENRILLLAILAISVALLLVAVGVSARYQSNLDEHYDRFGELIATAVSVGGAEKLMSPLSPELKAQRFVEELLDLSPDVAAIEFYDRQGVPIVQSKRSVGERDLRRAKDFSAPVMIHDEQGEAQSFGSVHVKLTGKTVQDIENGTKTIVLLIFMSAWIISIIAVVLNTYILSKHLRTLVKGVKQLSQGDFGVTIAENDLWGELKHLARSFNDMAGRLQAYEAQNLDTITFERNKLQAVLLSIADGVIVCDPSGQIVIMNDSACRMLGVKAPSVLLGTPLRDYLTEDGQKCFEPLIEEFQEQCLEHPERTPENLSAPVEMPGIGLKVIVSRIQDMEGSPLGFVMILHDVTKEMEVDKLKTNFISNVSHELRTPVTTIKSYVDTLYHHGQDLDPETYQEFMDTINTETDRLKKLVNDILDFSRLEEGGVKLELEAEDLSPIISLTVQSVKVLAQQKNLTLTTAIESNLPRVLVHSDSIERVLRNLLSNAIKYTEAGGRIKVRAEVSANGDQLEVSVQDTGIGIPEEHLPYIFDRFYRVENKVHTVRGTGLGLHLVKVAIEEHHHGMVFVHSTPGEGSTFGFRLPLAPAAVSDELVSR